MRVRKCAHRLSYLRSACRSRSLFLYTEVCCDAPCLRASGSQPFRQSEFPGSRVDSSITACHLCRPQRAHATKQAREKTAEAEHPRAGTRQAARGSERRCASAASCAASTAAHVLLLLAWSRWDVGAATGRWQQSDLCCASARRHGAAFADRAASTSSCARNAFSSARNSSIVCEFAGTCRAAGSPAGQLDARL